MLIQVFHHDPAAPLADPVHVATVELPNQGDFQALETAWTFTNNIDGSWSRGPQCDWGNGLERNSDYHPEVTVHAPLPTHLGRVHGIRSSMVNDIFVIDDRRYRVASMGFKPINLAAMRKAREERA